MADTKGSAQKPSNVDARRAIVGGLLGLIAAGVPAALLWGYTVDDALVTARMAHHLATGIGYRFNADGPVVDAVTPLGYAHLLVPFARDSVVATWQWARWLGLGAWLLAAAWLGVQVERANESPWRWGALVPLACCSPIAAWAGSGMETGIVTALATIAVTPSRAALLAAGWAVAWRPELAPWGAMLALGRAWEREGWPRHIPGNLALALVPLVGVMLVRGWVFGSAAPLAVLAKPSDLQHGLAYAVAALLWTGVPCLAVSRWALGAGERWPVPIVAACGAHFVSLVLVGGDWMALFRLAVPVLPGLILVGAATVAQAPAWATALRLGAATAIGVVLFVGQGRAARGVTEHRLQLIAEARPLLADARRVAAADIGWVGAATSAHVVDLAGITDPTIAVLPGGHTSKRVGSGLLRARDVDHVVLLLAPDVAPTPDWGASPFAKVVEARVAIEASTSDFAVEGTVALGGTRQRYLVVSRAEVE